VARDLHPPGGHHRGLSAVTALLPGAGPPPPFCGCGGGAGALAARGAALAGPRLGLGMQAIREDEDAAEATGVAALGLKLRALVLSTGLAGAAGGLFAYYHVSYYPVAS